ncbi:MAG: class I SAM-dependent methyltransferase [Planctomycetaceae bacterium]
MGTGIFERYAEVYDAVYLEKDYRAECDFLECAICRWAPFTAKRILDLGCGTGSHALELAGRGYQVVGVDRSAQMLSVARQKAIESGLSESLQFQQADACEWQGHGIFDVVISMFSVLSYQTTDRALEELMRTARRALRVGSLFLADFWFEPAVISQRPERRVKKLKTSNGHAMRTCTPYWDPKSHIVHVSCEVVTFEGEVLSETIYETHSMRYFSLPEIQDQLTKSGFTLVHFCAFPQIHELPSVSSWNVALVARAIKEEPPQ